MKEIFEKERGLPFMQGLKIKAVKPFFGDDGKKKFQGEIYLEGIHIAFIKEDRIGRGCNINVNAHNKGKYNAFSLFARKAGAREEEYLHAALKASIIHRRKKYLKKVQ